MVVKTYRGMLAHGGQDVIPLSTKDGSVGYRIIKFQTINDAPGTQDREFVTKIFKSEQTSINGTINFADNDLLAMSALSITASASEPYMQEIIFDKEIFNQDIFISTFNTQASSGNLNYYIELEQMKLDKTQNMSVTLKAIRGI